MISTIIPSEIPHVSLYVPHVSPSFRHGFRRNVSRWSPFLSLDHSAPWQWRPAHEAGTEKPAPGNAGGALHISEDGLSLFKRIHYL